MKTITGKTKVWLSEIWGPEGLCGEGNVIVSRPIYSNSDMSSHGFMMVGEAEITIKAVSGDDLVLNKIESLKAQKTSILAEAQEKATRIDEKVQKLLAISYKPETEAA